MEAPPPEVPTAPAEDVVEPHLPMEERPDGTLVIDLAPLGQPVADCEQREPDPVNPEIVVCRKLDGDQRIASAPQVDGFGNAVPRAQIQLSEDASVSLNAEQKGVGGIPANAALITVEIDF
ncbi:MAG: hypothetical protein AAGL68_04875 [Pseudomonadota bacterium]